MNHIDLTGQRAVVTGGAQGIGRAVAERLLGSGAAVSLRDGDGDRVRSTMAELTPLGKVHG
jgi:3-oxoacyl-[acyl-carrier protein] reductase